MFATRALRQAAQHAERVPLIKFVGKRSIPASVDHSPHPHPASPKHSLPADWASGSSSSGASAPPKHTSFSNYRDHAQQFGPLQNSIRGGGDPGVGGRSGHQLGPVVPQPGEYFDRNELPARFRRQPLSAAEIEAVEMGGAFA